MGRKRRIFKKSEMRHIEDYMRRNPLLFAESIQEVNFLIEELKIDFTSITDIEFSGRLVEKLNSEDLRVKLLKYLSKVAGQQNSEYSNVSVKSDVKQRFDEAKLAHPKKCSTSDFLGLLLDSYDEIYKDKLSC